MRKRASIVQSEILILGRFSGLLAVINSRQVQNYRSTTTVIADEEILGPETLKHTLADSEPKQAAEVWRGHSYQVPFS